MGGHEILAYLRFVLALQNVSTDVQDWHHLKVRCKLTQARRKKNVYNQGANSIRTRESGIKIKAEIRASFVADVLMKYYFGYGFKHAEWKHAIKT